LRTNVAGSDSPSSNYGLAPLANRYTEPVAHRRRAFPSGWNWSLAAGPVVAAQNLGTAWALVGMSIAAMGFYGSKGPFWAIPSMILTGTAAAFRNRLDQFDRQSRRLLRADNGGLGQGLHRQLCRLTLARLLALMSAVISALWLRISNPVRQELASVPGIKR